MKTIKTPLAMLLAATALSLGTGCTPQTTTTPSTRQHVALSAAEATSSMPLALASGDMLGLELHMAADH